VTDFDGVNYEVLTIADQYALMIARLGQAEREHFDADWNVKSLEFSQDADNPDQGITGQIEYQTKQKVSARKKIEYLNEQLAAMVKQHPELKPDVTTGGVTEPDQPA
jgi:hypothetical protein